MPLKPVDFTPAIIDGSQALAKIVGAKIAERKAIQDALAAYANRLRIISIILQSSPLDAQDIAEMETTARAALSASIKSEKGVAQAKVASATNAAAKAFIELGKSAITAFPG